MPRPASVGVDYRQFAKRTDGLQDLAAHAAAFAVEYQVLIAGMIAIQGFYFFEGALESIAAKLVCGARYDDGSTPVILHPAITLDDALRSMQTMGRQRPKRILKWNRAKEIRSNVIHVMDGAEAFIAASRNHSSRINEIRVVRNHIAHNNSLTRQEFSAVVQRRLGATPPRLPKAGAFVLRETGGGIRILEEYIATMKAIVRDATKA